MSLWDEFSQLTVVGGEIFNNPLFKELNEDFGVKINITYVPNLEALRERKQAEHLNGKKSSKTKPEAILLSEFPSPSDIKSLNLFSENARVFGLPSLYAMRFHRRRWTKVRPVYCFAMADAVVTISGYRDPVIVNRIASLINCMGGSVRRNFDDKVTHLIAYRCDNDKVRKAARTSVNVATMKASWVESAWELRIAEPFLNACDLDFVNTYRAKVFQNCSLYFVGFPPNGDTITEVKAIVTEHDGQIADSLQDDRLTHVVVYDDWHKNGSGQDLKSLIVKVPLATEKPSDTPAFRETYRVPILRLDWFWKSLQSTCICDPRDYHFMADDSSGESVADPFSPRPSVDTLSKENTDPRGLNVTGEGDGITFQGCTSPSFLEQSTVIHRKRDSICSFATPITRDEVIAQLADPLRMTKSSKRISKGSLKLLDFSPTSPPGDMQARCVTPKSADIINEKIKSPRTPLEAIRTSLELSPLFHRASPSSADKKTPVQNRLKDREHRVFEFFLTERNYFGILEYLTQAAYSEVIAEDQVGGPIIPKTEAEIVFGKLIPIYQLHERLQSRLVDLENSWDTERGRLGELLLPYIDEIEKVYSHYMQFYSAPHVQQLGKDYPRFLAFMRQVERRKESGRQSLSDLLVRPVQRLPSMLLLVQGILKFTPLNHPDHRDMAAFVNELTSILDNINACLKKNDDYVSLLNLYHDIQNAPPEMVSSSRSIISKLDVFFFDTKGREFSSVEPATLFLLNDCIEVARPKRRNTGEPLHHAIQAALAAVEGDPNVIPMEVKDEALPAQTVLSATSSSATLGSSISVSRNGSGASSGSTFIRGTESKKRYAYSHIMLIKLQNINRVLDLEMLFPERAAFCLVGYDDMNDDAIIYTFGLAASFTASIAMNSGKCPEAVESAVMGNLQGNPISRRPSFKDYWEKTPSKRQHQGQQNQKDLADDVATKLQHCVQESKTRFLHQVCHHIVQVSFVATSIEDLLVVMAPEMVLGYNIESAFENAAFIRYTSKKFSRQIGRAVSLKTPRKTVPHLQQRMADSDNAAFSSAVYLPTTFSTPSDIPIATNRIATEGEDDEEEKDVYLTDQSGVSKPSVKYIFSTPARPSVLGSIFSGFRSHAMKPVTPGTPFTKKSDAVGQVICRNVEDEHLPESALLSDSDNNHEDYDMDDADGYADVYGPPLGFSGRRQQQQQQQEDHFLDAVGEYEAAEEQEEDEAGIGVEDEGDFMSLGSNPGAWNNFVAPPAPSSSLSSRASSAKRSTVGYNATSSTSSFKSLTQGGRQSFSGMINSTRKSICRSLLDTIRRPRAHDLHDRTPSTTSLGRAPLAEVDEDEAAERSEMAPISRGNSGASWFSRHRIARIHSVDSRTPGGTPGLDKSMSECNLTARGNQAAALGATSSTSSFKNIFASPFRVPRGPPLRKSIARRQVPPPAKSTQSSAALPTWSSLIALGEDKKRKQADKNNGAEGGSGGEDREGSSLAQGALKSATKDKANRRLYGSAIFHRSSSKNATTSSNDDDEQRRRRQSGGVGAPASRRESFFRKKFK